MAISLDGSASNIADTASSVTVTLTTTNTKDVIIVSVLTGGNSAPVTVSSISDGSSLTWTKRSSENNGHTNCEVWWAIASSILSSDVITVTLSGTSAGSAIVAFGLSGADTLAPWDTNASLPAVAQNHGGGPVLPAVTGVSTSAADSWILGFLGASNGLYGNTAGSGFTIIQFPEDFSNFAFLLTEYQSETSAQSNLTVTCSGTNNSNDWVAIADAIVPVPVSPGKSQCFMVGF